MLIPESNLGFEAQHIVQAVTRSKVTGWMAMSEGARDSVGLLTTNDSKAAMCKATQEVLSFGAIDVARNLVSLSQPPQHSYEQLLAELRTFAVVMDVRGPFSAPRMTFSGKVGGQQDDLCITLQLCILGMNIFMRKDKYAAWRPRFML